jgi:citronellyl-CoA synthetase
MATKIREIAKTAHELSAVLKLAAVVRPRPLDTRDGLGAWFDSIVHAFGDQPAVIFEGRTLSWSELSRLSNQYAACFRELGLRRGDVASVILENRIEMLATIFGLAKLGVTAALINTNLTGRPLKHCIDVTQSSLCIFGEERIQAVSDIRDQLQLGDREGYVFVRDQGEQQAPQWAIDLVAMAQTADDSNPPETAEVTLGDTVFNIFTSGTTGLPKAAVVSNRRLQQAASMSHQAGLRCTGNDRIYLCLPLYHGTGLFLGLGAAVMSGATMVVRRRFSASQFLPEVREHGVTCFIYIGELCRYLMNSPQRPDDADTPLERIMGNGLRPDIWQQFRERFGIARVSEFYGSSEGNVAFANLLNKDCTVGMTSAKVALVQYDVDADEIVRDANGYCVEVKAGEPGLLLGKITNKTVFEGYTNKDATEQKILRNALKKGDAWFNTGDLMRTVDVGFAMGFSHYQFVDRVGDTFRWKAENVSTNEVGEIICSHPSIAFCNVYGVEVPGADGRAGMAAVVLAEGEQTLDLQGFSDFIAAELPNYARPVFIRVLSEMDTTGTFKMVKGDLRKQSYDLSQVADRMFVLKPGSKRYELLEENFYRDIQAGEGGY